MNELKNLVVKLHPVFVTCSAAVVAYMAGGGAHLMVGPLDVTTLLVAVFAYLAQSPAVPGAPKAS